METFMADNEDDWVRKRAYSLWEEEGYPAGKHLEHWERAKREFESFSPLKRRSPRTSSKAAAAGSPAAEPAETTRKATRTRKVPGS